MGHKVHPTGFRIGVIRDWQAKWYADKHYAEFLQEDLKLRKAIQKKYADALSPMERSGRLAPENAEVFYDLAVIRLANGKESEALEALKKSLSLNPKLEQNCVAPAV